MCAIVDKNVIHRLFDPNRRQKGDELFFRWMEGAGRIVIGGGVRSEFYDHCKAKEWAQQVLVAGKIRELNYAKVNARTKELKKSNLCKSNDRHVIALAQLSGARLLYTLDKLLMEDFKNPALVNKPRGKIYKSEKTKKLLEEKDLCPDP